MSSPPLRRTGEAGTEGEIYSEIISRRRTLCSFNLSSWYLAPQSFLVSAQTSFSFMDFFFFLFVSFFEPLFLWNPFHFIFWILFLIGVTSSPSVFQTCADCCFHQALSVWSSAIFLVSFFKAETWSTPLISDKLQGFTWSVNCDLTLFLRVLGHVRPSLLLAHGEQDC